MSREWYLLWSQRLILAGLAVELLSLFGLYRSWGFMLFAVAGITPIVAGVALYIAGAIQGEQASRRSG